MDEALLAAIARNSNSAGVRQQTRRVQALGDRARKLVVAVSGLGDRENLEARDLRRG
ncbi:hypothetical protein ACFQI3_10605 [Hansschlegelia quercus]|uniref:hypothetical protein n=1 Tax=Hansschlegelia quercus TaxID=2528245 RepID=UPI0013EEF30B|nr:hypothetical protein [Hansschlegelia quercus]